MVFPHMIPDLIDEGIIVIDAMGYIKVYNQMARDIFGIDPGSGPGHPKGKIEDGDIVIIANNMLGADDGNMQPKDLKLIGVNPKGIKQGYAVAAVGKKAGKANTGICKWVRPGCNSDLLLDTTVKGNKIQVGIYFDKKRLSIKINTDCYDYDYLWAAGHMVVLDGRQHTVKFYQYKGYTPRKEEMKSVLRGHPFRGKGKYGRSLQTLNNHILDLHPETEIIEKLLNVARGNNGHFKGMESLLNGIPVRCSVKAVKKGNQILGALLEITDITELKAVQEERQRALISYQLLEERLISEKNKNDAFKHIIGSGSKLKHAVETAKKVAETNSTVLLLGESGTGKNLFAEAIHMASPRRNHPFVYINCASIPDNLLESELFGHEKGSFTGAIAEKQGKFEQANKGTIFLDEISELPYSLQAKLLHVLQSKSFTRVGGLQPHNVDIRIIAASNNELEGLVNKGLFRSDLFYRINVLSITIPPLREHKEDLYLLIEYLGDQIKNRIGCAKKKISPEVYTIFLNHNWPGNVRELENVLERAMIMSGETIHPEHLPQYLLRETHRFVGDKPFLDINNIGPIKKIVAEAEKKAIVKALEITNGNRKRAMTLLQMGKTNFYEKLKKFAIPE